MINGVAYMTRALAYDNNKKIALIPLLSYDFNHLTQFIPGKRLMRYFYQKDSFSIMPIDWYLAYLHILLSLRVIWYKQYSGCYFVFNPASEWAPALDTYTYSREFLEYLLEDLTKEEQTESALLVIKKLSEMGEEAGRFAI